LIAVSNALDSVDDLPWAFVAPTIYTQVEMNYSLIAATIPCMRIFLKNFSTGYLGTTADQVDPTLTMKATKGSDSYAMSSVRSRHITQNTTSSSGRSGRGKMRDADWRGDGAATLSRIVHPHTPADSVDSDDGSDKIIIRKTVCSARMKAL